MTTLRSSVARCAAVYDSHPSLSLTLGPAYCDFFLFRKMKLKLKRRRFDSIKEIQPESQDVIKTLKRNDFP
jgi:hypothetical protein